MNNLAVTLDLVAAIAGRRLVLLFDWTDAAVTFPALDIALLAQSSGVDDRDGVLDAYAAVWREGFRRPTSTRD